MDEPNRHERKYMNADRFLSNTSLATISLTAALILGGCHNAAPAPDDVTLNTQVQSRLFSDQSLSGQAIQTAVRGGVVTLTGTVATDSARSNAGGDAGQIAGVKTVVNNIVVQTANPESAGVVPMPMPMRAQPAPVPAAKAMKPSATVAQAQPQPPAPIVRSSPQPPQPSPQQQQTVMPPPPAAPVIHNITLPTGTTIPIRITQTLDSATTQTGDRFTGAVASDIVQDGIVVLAQGTPVTGQVDAAQDAGHFKGSSLLTISLSSINPRGQRIQIATEPYSKQGEGRGKNTAEKVGGGAAVGAIIGGIFGGGKGAAIGAAAGGGLGAGANTITRGQQVQIPSESVVRFRLTESITVRVNSDHSGGEQAPVPALERRPLPVTQ
jgi:hypothetical protein